MHKEEETKLKTKLQKKRFYLPLTLDDQTEKFNNQSYTIIHNPVGHGNCQFCALSHFLRENGFPKYTLQRLRQEVVDYLQRHPLNSDGEPFENFALGTLEDYLTEIARNGFYGDHITLYAISMIYDKMGMAFKYDKLKVPKKSVINKEIGMLPYFLVGDEIFPLKSWLIRPYPGIDLSYEKKKIHNYRHSRARRVIENSFGILSTRWIIFHKAIKATTENAENYILAYLTLHNYLRQTDNAMYKQCGFLDSENNDGSIKEDKWRSMKEADNAFKNINPIRGSCYTKNALEVRESLKDYVNSESGSVS